MNTKHTPAPKIISVEETEDFIIKWYNEHLSFKQISDIINERAEKIVATNSELLEALQELVYQLCGEQEAEEEIEKAFGITTAMRIKIAKAAIKKATE